MTDQPAPAPGAPAPLPPPAAPAQGGVRPLDLLAAAILVVGGVLALCTTFAPMKHLTLGRLGFGPGGQQVTVTMDLWGSHYSGPTFAVPDEPLRLGIPLVIGAILLIVLTLLALPTGNNRRVVVLRPLSIGAAGVVIGTIWTVALYFSNVDGSLPSGLSKTDGAGRPLLIAAGAVTGLGLIVALVGFWRGRLDAPAGPAGPIRPPRSAGDVVAYAIEPETPPYGIPMAGPVAEIPDSQENPPPE